MAIVGIGTDIVKTSRISHILQKHPDTFPQRILHESELRVYEQHYSPASFMAKRFAAKEAAAKALGTGIAKGVSFHDIAINNNEQGQPNLNMYGETLNIANALGVQNMHISLSDEGEYALAYVILES